MNHIHPQCHGLEGHICQQLSGFKCIERDCNKPAGTRWGPYWCPEHDAIRLARVDDALNRLMADIEALPRDELA